MKRVNKLALILVLFFGFVLFNLSSMVVAEQSNKSLEVKAMLDQSLKDINEMQSLGIPITRVNESYYEALQIYNGQLAYESSGRSADYKVVIQYTTNIGNIKTNALKAEQELKVFREEYQSAKEGYDLSSMQADYDEIEKSYSEERFEDTLSLIDKAYAKISDIQSSQTALKLYSDSVSKTFKKFIYDNWVKIVIILAIVIVFLIVFWTTFKKLRIRSKIDQLNVQKITLNSLIKKLQYEYFETKKLSETEFKVKLEHFKEMIRDIDRQIPLLKEDLAKIDKKEIEIKTVRKKR